MNEKKGVSKSSGKIPYQVLLIISMIVIAIMLIKPFVVSLKFWNDQMWEVAQNFLLGLGLLGFATFIAIHLARTVHNEKLKDLELKKKLASIKKPGFSMPVSITNRIPGKLAGPPGSGKQAFNVSREKPASLPQVPAKPALPTSTSVSTSTSSPASSKQVSGAPSKSFGQSFGSNKPKPYDKDDDKDNYKDFIDDDRDIKDDNYDEDDDDKDKD